MDAIVGLISHSTGNTSKYTFDEGMWAFIVAMNPVPYTRATDPGVGDASSTLEFQFSLSLLLYCG